MTTLRTWRQFDVRARGLLLFSITLICLNALGAVPYFRYRNLNLAFFGWLLLLALAVPLVSTLRWRRALVVVGAGLLVMNVALLQERLPAIRANETLQTVLCEEEVPEPLGRAIATEYQLQPDCFE